MDTHVHNQTHSRVAQPWNKGKLTGAKPPLKPETRLGDQNTAPIIETLQGSRAV